jgi:hypothetical protein
LTAGWLFPKENGGQMEDELAALNLRIEEAEAMLAELKDSRNDIRSVLILQLRDELEQHPRIKDVHVSWGGTVWGQLLYHITATVEPQENLVFVLAGHRNPHLIAKELIRVAENNRPYDRITYILVPED